MRFSKLSPALIVALACGVAAFADVPVQFYDERGNLITGQNVEVTAVDPSTGATVRVSLPADPDGTYDVPVSPGDEVRFRVHVGDEELGTRSEVKLKIPQPSGEPLPVVLIPQGSANDTCTSAQPVNIGSVTSDTTVGATLDGVPFCGTSNTAPGVWFSVVGNGTTLTASTCETVGSPPGSADYDTKISVFCGGGGGCGGEDPCTTQTCVGGNDDSPGCNFHSALTWCSQETAVYRILVHGFGAETGNFGLSVSSNGQSCTSTIGCFAPVPFGACCVTAEPPFEQGETPVSCFEGPEAECSAEGGVYQGACSTCIVTVGEFHYVAHPALAIPDANPAGVSHTINVTDSHLVADLNVDLGINHTWVSDLIIRVTGPTGASQVIWNQVCGSTDNINATADDEGTETVCAPLNAGPIDSVFYPPTLAGDGPLAVFDGTQALGIWTINVSDNVAADTGTLNQWSLHFVEGAPVCPSFQCPPPGGAGGTGGSGGCPDDDDEDEDSDSSHATVEVEGTDSGGTPVEVGLRGSGSPASGDQGVRFRRLRDQP